MNAEYIDALNSTIENSTNCDGLLETIDRVNALQADMLQSITDQLAALAPLITVPDPSEMLGYIESVVDHFTAQYNALLAQQVDLALSIATLTASINAKISELNCSI